MIDYNIIRQKYIGNRNLVDNVLGAFAVRGLGFLISFVLFPLYLRYFNNNAILGCWFTMYSVLSCIQVLNGQGKLKCQLYGFLFATLFKVVAIVLLALQASWTLVVIAMIIGLLPYCIVQPVLMHRQLQALNKKEEVQHG